MTPGSRRMRRRQRPTVLLPRPVSTTAWGHAPGSDLPALVRPGRVRPRVPRSVECVHVHKRATRPLVGQTDTTPEAAAHGTAPARDGLESTARARRPTHDAGRASEADHYGVRSRPAADLRGGQPRPSRTPHR